MKQPITVIVLTLDEEVNIEACLRSVAWAEDLVVVDSGSTDRTLDIVRETAPGARILSHPFRDFGQQRNWALDHAQPRHEWVLFLDADERSTPAFAGAVARHVREAGATVGFFVTYRFMFLGRWIRHCTLYPSWQLRLLKRGRVRFRREGHGQREVTEGPLDYVGEPMDHLGFSKGTAEWVERHNHYSSNEVELIRRLRGEPLAVRELFRRDPVLRRRSLKRLAARVPGRPVWRFLYMYVFRLGFLDGRPGLLYCLLRFAHEVHIVAKLAEDRAETIR